MQNWDGYSDYCNDVHDRECAWHDGISFERKKELEKLDDLKENLVWMIENINNGELVGRFNLQDALFRMCDLLEVSSKDLEEKVKFDEVA